MKVLGRIFAMVFCGFLAVGTVFAHDNSPAWIQVIPEAVWATASGGGTWVTEVQITTFTDNTDVKVWFMYNGGIRGPITLQTGLSIWQSRGYTNILSSLQSLEGGAFTYSGRVGALWFQTQDTTKKIHVQARTRNGNYGKTFQGLGWVDSNQVQFSPSVQRGVIQNLVNNSTYRTFVGFVNTTSYAITVEFIVVAFNNTGVGVPFTKTIPAYGFVSFNPFEEAGRPYPTYSHTNCWLYISPQSGTGKLMGFGSSADNYTNDSAAHSMVQFQ